MKFSAHQRRIFVFTWIAYAGFYLCRKNLSVVLPALERFAGMGSMRLANIVFGFMLLYVIGQFVCGMLSDRFGPRRVVGTGLILSAGCNLLMTAHGSYGWLLCLACLNGVAQSTGWSGLVKLMASWFKGENRGVVMAWWGTNYVLGGFAATAFATWTITESVIFPGLGWRRGFLFPALLLLGIALLFLGGVREKPPEPDMPESGAQPNHKEHSGWTNLVELLRKPSLWMVTSSYFFLEMARYAFLFWLPLYMVQRLRYSIGMSGYLSSFFELLGIVGALIAGYASDRLAKSRRAPVAVVMLIGLGCTLLFEPLLTHLGPVAVAIVMSMAGIFCYGPDTLVSGAFSQDLGGEHAAGTASGLVDGIGHLGALLSPYVVVYVSGHFGWDLLFPVLGAGAFLAAVLMMPLWNHAPRSTRMAEYVNKDPLLAEQ